MTNQSSNLFGGGLIPDLRSPGRRRGVRTLCLMLGLLVCALPAMAAEIVEVRVGRHPEFTRVVFELDRAAGYRIERSNPSSDTAGLVVSLEATSTPMVIDSAKSLIEQVTIESVGPRSVAHVRLAKDGLRLKEMILANPPRIVLDVHNDEPVVAQTPAPTPVASEDDTAFEDVVAEIPVEVEVEVVEVEVEPRIIPEPEPVIAEMADESDEAFGEDPQMAAGQEPSTSTPVEERTDELEVVEVESEPIDPIAEPVPVRPNPRVAKTSTSDDGGGGWMTWALVGVGAVFLLLGGVFVARRRGASDDEFDDDDDSDHYADEETVVEAVGENPFSGLAGDDSDMEIADREISETQPGVTGDGDAATVSFSIDSDDEEKESESVVFEDSEETVMDDMEVISREQVNESLTGGMPPAMGGGVSEEFQQMMVDMGRRVEALEGRIDELVDARDRLERQVAAQTEELRVQRAAIARTQRAVRNLGRPEDAEQEATEPALRDPNQPSSE